MSVEEILIKQAHSHVFTSKVYGLIANEILKGCNPQVRTQPVALEPYYEPLRSIRNQQSTFAGADCVFESALDLDDLQRFQVWMSPQQLFDWNNNELFVKQLYSTSHRIGFEIVGNADRILILLLCHKDDAEIVRTAFRGQYENCELTEFSTHPINLLEDFDIRAAQFHDYYPLPPYSRLLTQPIEFQQSPYETLIQTISDLTSEEFIWYQVLFQPVSYAHNWHRNIEILLDLEYHARLMGDACFPHRTAQQLPSGDLHHMSIDSDSKAHNDKPLFAAAIRMLYLHREDGHRNRLNALSTFIRFFQHGGRPLHYVEMDDYIPVIGRDDIHEMFSTGTAYRPGFLVNTQELSGLVHLPDASVLERRNISIDVLESLTPQESDLSAGTRIGTCTIANQSTPIHIPLPIRMRHTQVIGRPGMGKSCMLEHMILDNVSQGFGVAVLDPHGDLIDRILNLMPEDAVERTVYFDPGDPDWIPLWNPLNPIQGQDVGRMADDLVNAFKNVVSGWGDRLEHLLRHAMFALIQLPNTTLLDVSRLMSFNSPESKAIRKKIQNVIQNESARQFWNSDFSKYGKEDFGPPKHKLSKLLLSDTVSLMLSQPENRFDFHRFMDEGAVVLINLSTIGSELRDILGCFLLAIFRLTALSRANVAPDRRKPFHIYCDEAHRFISGAIEDLIAETRKFGVSLTLAHQYLSQFNYPKADALASVGSTVIFNIDSKDARTLSKDLRGKVEIDDLISMDVGEAITRIGTEIVRIHTPPPLEMHTKSFRDQILAHSHRRYCKSKNEILSSIRDGFMPPSKSAGPPIPISYTDKRFEYDEFD